MHYDWSFPRKLTSRAVRPKRPVSIALLERAPDACLIAATRGPSLRGAASRGVATRADWKIWYDTRPRRSSLVGQRHWARGDKTRYSQQAAHCSGGPLVHVALFCERQALLTRWRNWMRMSVSAFSFTLVLYYLLSCCDTHDALLSSRVRFGLFCSCSVKLTLLPLYVLCVYVCVQSLENVLDSLLVQSA